MRKRIFLYILSLFLAVIAVSFCVYFSYPFVPMFNVKIHKLVRVAFSDRNLLVLDKAGSRLFVANKDGKIIFVSSSRLSQAPDNIVDVAIDDKYMYLAGHDTKNGGLYCTKEHVEQYDLHGRHVRTLYSDNIPEDKQVIDASIASADTYKGSLYIARIAPSGYEASVLCFGRQGKTQGIYNVRSSFKIQYAYYHAQNNKLVFTDIFNRPYAATEDSQTRSVGIAEFYGDADVMNVVLPAVARANRIGILLLAKHWCWPLCEDNGSCHTYAFARELADDISFCNILKDNVTDVTKIEKFDCSTKLIFFTFISFIAVVWLLLSLLYGIWKLMTKCNLDRKNIIYAVACFFVVTGLILYYSYNIRVILVEQYKAKTYALSHISIHDMEHLMPDFMGHLREHMLQGQMFSSTYQKQMENIITHFNNLCADSGERDRFYIRLMICGNNEVFINCIDTTKEYPCGYNFTMDTLQRCMKAIAADSWSSQTTSQGRAVSSFRPLYDENNVLAAIIETGYCTENLNKLAIKKSFLLFVSLLTILIFLVPMLFYVFRKADKKGEE